MHYVWCDGCANQFKGVRSWFHVSRDHGLATFLELLVGCMIQWNYWGIGHGKGPRDGVGACFKQAIRKEKLTVHMVKICKTSMMWFCTFKGQWTNLMIHMKVLERMLEKFFEKWKTGILIKLEDLITRLWQGLGVCIQCKQ